MKQLLRTIFFKYGYLLIAAAWLYTISFIVINYGDYYASPEKVQQRLQNKISATENNIAFINADTAFITKLINDSLTQNPLLGEESLPFGFFIHTVNSNGNLNLVFWNNNHYYIAQDDLLVNDGNYFVNYQNGSFELVRHSITINNKKVLTTALIPIHWKYFIENKYLHENFDGFPNLHQQYDTSSDAHALPIVSNNGKTLFHIKAKAPNFSAHYDWLTILLRVLAVCLLCIFIHLLAVAMATKKGFAIGFLWLLSMVLFLRCITYILPFPFQFSQLYLFDASVYASSKLHPSLGDLLINTILVFWLIFYCKYQSLKQNYQYYFLQHPYLKFIYLIACTASALIAASIVRGLVQDSKISFDVANFFSLNLFSVVSFVILCLIALAFFHLSHFLIKPLVDASTPIALQIVVVAASGLLFLTIFIGHSNSVSNLFVIAWLMGYIWLLNLRKQDIYLPLLRSPFFIFWVMIFAVGIALLVSYQNKVVEWEQRKKMAERLAIQSDPDGESLLEIAMGNFDDNTLAKNFYRLQFEYANKYIKDSLLTGNFSGYLNRFETHIYSFDSAFRPLYNEDATTFASLQSILANKGKKVADDNDLYTFQNSNNQLNYIFSKIIHTNADTLGYLFVVAEPKRYKSEALYPELFKQEQGLYIEATGRYAYAVYLNGNMMNRFNEYDFPTRIPLRQTSVFEYRSHKANGSTELWFNAGNGKEVVIVRDDIKLIEVGTLFAYLFFTFLLVISAFHVINYLLKIRFRSNQISRLLRMSIRSQIHGTIIFISLFSFVIIGFATITFFIDRFSNVNEERLSRSIQIMANEIEAEVAKLQGQALYDDQLTLQDAGFTKMLDKNIRRISEVHNVDVNYFNTSGNLITSTQPYIYNKYLLSKVMNPVAYRQLRFNKKTKFLQSEKIGNLAYVSIYVPVVDEQGNTYAYLNIPYLNSEVELNQEISNFIATLINLNAFVFLLAGAIAFLLTERIISSFKVIGDKMKEVNLGKQNEVIIWNKNDEITPLVTEYNKMVQKLEQSAEALAVSEREGAWREMARQVAHEIKNPLTPMKLSIQYLQKSIDNNAPNTKELSQKVAKTLVEQIDQLAKIAGDFSQFANIGNASVERIKLSEVINAIIQLYAHDDRVNIQFAALETNDEVLADKAQLSRLFTNLIKNAIESVPDTMPVQIKIQEQSFQKKIVVLVSDNGGGIPFEMRDKMFTPNFTTKTSGTGLGLAICKGIVENAGGAISFITGDDGTTFSVTLPTVS